MEFYRKIDRKSNEIQLQDLIRPNNVETFTETMLFLEAQSSYFKGVTLWGDFNISYHKIKGGVRFCLLDCPNALSWTITTGLAPEEAIIVLHLTINRTEKPKEFIEEIHEFLDEWEAGLNSYFK